MLSSLLDVLFYVVVFSILVRVTAEMFLNLDLSASPNYYRVINFMMRGSFYPAGYLLDKLRDKFPSLRNLDLGGLAFDLTPALLLLLIHLVRIAIIMAGALVAQILLIMFTV